MELLLKNLTFMSGAVGDIPIPRIGKKIVVDFSGYFIYPGLVNWHDHLEMNLYPRLGTPLYNNYTEWMKDIYKPKESPIREIEKTDIDYRLLWGGLKNLISGVTTVYHHNPSRRILRKRSFPVSVPDFEWAHSLAVTKKFKFKKDKLFIIHAAEGIDEFAAKETTQLDELGLLQKNTLIVHGIMADWNLVERRGASVIWCPASNLYMFNKTADVQGKAPMVFLGTDSTLTGSPTLLDEMRVAAQFVSKQDVLSMVSYPYGDMDPVDFFIASKKTNDPLDNLFMLHPMDIMLVVKQNKIRLQDSTVGLPPLKYNLLKTKQVNINVDKIKSHFRKIVGTKILEQNPLWNLLS